MIFPWEFALNLIGVYWVKKGGGGSSFLLTSIVKSMNQVRGEIYAMNIFPYHWNLLTKNLIS